VFGALSKDYEYFYKRITQWAKNKQ
jgi:hypothetical protein